MSPARRRSLQFRRLAPLAVLALLAACATGPPNPAFPLTVSDAKAELRAMADDPRPLDRPVVVVGGWNDPGIGASVVAGRLRAVTSTPELVIEAPMFSPNNFDSAARQLVRLIEDAAASADPVRTVEVDVVGISMGGLVARHAALPEAPGGKRLVIRRLFTIGTPHNGAAMASTVTLDARVRDMTAGSPFLTRLDEHAPAAAYEVVPYVRLGDAIVGEENAGWDGQGVWWLPNPPFEFAHLNSSGDARFSADIARRLRAEPGYTIPPPAPLPDGFGPDANSEG